MKWILLLAIFAIEQYQDVTGSRCNHTGWCLYKETQAPLKVPDKDLDRPHAVRSLMLPFTINNIFNDTLVYIKIKLEFLEAAYQQIIAQLKDLIASSKGDKKDENTNEPSTPENITSNNTTQENATQTRPILDESTVNQKPTPSPPSENDDKEEKQEDKKDTLEPIRSIKKENINVPIDDKFGRSLNTKMRS